MKKILIADDEARIRRLVCDFLKNAGFETVEAADGNEAIEKFLECGDIDLVICDIMMPGADGYQVCQKIRTFSDVPIIFLTGKSTEDDKINGLLTGADDYIVKPYSLRELKARIDVLLRRFSKTKAPADNHTLQIQNLSIDKIAHKALFKGKDLCLANREYEVLLYLAEHPNKDVTFEELGSALFGSYQESDRRSVMVNVSRLRKKFEGNYELENMIETVWSKGYRFIKK